MRAHVARVGMVMSSASSGPPNTIRMQPGASFCVPLQGGSNPSAKTAMEPARAAGAHAIASARSEGAKNCARPGVGVDEVDCMIRVALSRRIRPPTPWMVASKV